MIPCPPAQSSPGCPQYSFGPMVIKGPTQVNLMGQFAWVYYDYYLGRTAIYTLFAVYCTTLTTGYNTQYIPVIAPWSRYPAWEMRECRWCKFHTEIL